MMFDCILLSLSHCHRERMEAMEKQIASLTGLVQNALLRGNEGEHSSDKSESINGSSGTGSEYNLHLCRSLPCQLFEGYAMISVGMNVASLSPPGESERPNSVKDIFLTQRDAAVGLVSQTFQISQMPPGSSDSNPEHSIENPGSKCPISVL
ncbi:hypothetical protein scyTo_0024179 [Scyliorhinus torazame]|uniref:Uncharacterized protein n=1 Tax=Scyliorhinus torazame TaxID=75743 RepID=A0A401QEE1_SCYTO|nr:hypothetical protein [Scyliorhinus torazame]